MPIQFISHYKGLKLVRVSEESRILPNGNSTTVAPELSYQFENGDCFVEPGQDLLADGPNGEEQDAAAWIRNFHWNDIHYHEVIQVAPEASELLSRVAVLASQGDIDGLLALGSEEQDGWQRPEVMNTIAATLEGLQAKA